MPRRTRLASLLLAALLSLGVVACNGGGTTDGESPADTATETES